MLYIHTHIYGRQNILHAYSRIYNIHITSMYIPTKEENTEYYFDLDV